MAPGGHDRPALNVVRALGPGPGRQQDLAGKRGVGRGDHDALAVRNRPRPMQARVIRPERRVDRAGDPVERHVREQGVFREASLDLTVAVAPRAELLDDPCRQPHR